MREADWRFLLPPVPENGYEHLVLLGGSKALATWLLDHGIARQITAKPSAAAGADALVVLGGGPDPIDEITAANLLGPEGVLYYEVSRDEEDNSGRTVTSVTRRLRSAGVDAFARYWVRTNGDVRQLYVPLDGAGALRWFLESRFPRLSATQWAKAAVLTGIVRTTGRIPGTVPRRFAIVGRRSNKPGPRWMLDGHPAVPPGKTGETLPVLVANGFDDRRRVVMLPFTSDRRYPSVALKLDRAIAHSPRTDRERKGLTTIRREIPEVLRESIPELVSICQFRSLEISMEGVVPGRPLSALTNSWNVRQKRLVEDYQLAVDWLIRFGKGTREVDPTWRIEDHSRYVESHLHEYLEVQRPGVEITRLLGQAKKRSLDLIGASVPLVWQHRDFTPENIVRSGDRIHVFDWEGAEFGLPLLDLVYFSEIWYRQIRRLRSWVGQETEIRRFLLGEPADPIVEAISGALLKYGRRVAVDRGFLPVLLTVYWTDRINRATRDGIRRLNERLRSYECFLEQLALNQDRLFQEEPTRGPPPGDRNSRWTESRKRLRTKNNPV